MRKLYGIAIALAAIMLLSPVAAGFNISDSEIDEEIPISLNASEPAFDENMVDISSMSNDSLIQSIGQIESEAILSIDSVSMAQINSASAESIKSAIINGTPLVLSGDSSSLNALDGMSIVMDKNADVTVIYCDPLTKNLHYFTVDSENNAQTIAMDWLNSKIAERNANKSQSASSTASNDVGNKLVSEDVKESSTGNKLIVHTEYEKIGRSNDNNYYITKYNLSVKLNGAWHISIMNNSCDVDKLNSNQKLITYGPNRFEGENSERAIVDLTLKQGLIDFNRSWTYDRGSIFIDYGETDSNYFYIDHVMEYNNEYAGTNFAASPGTITSASVLTNYYVEEQYMVKFCKPYNGIWPWDPDYSYDTISITLNALINNQ